MLDKVQLPTVGRIVHYHDPEHVEPFAGIVAVAKANRYTIPVLHVFLHDGTRVMNDVHHKDDARVRGLRSPCLPYWDWMDYQKGQAVKTEALQAELERLAKPIGRMITDEDRKTQCSTPSPEDGKR